MRIFRFMILALTALVAAASCASTPNQFNLAANSDTIPVMFNEGAASSSAKHVECDSGLIRSLTVYSMGDVKISTRSIYTLGAPMADQIDYYLKTLPKALLIQGLIWKHIDEETYVGYTRNTHLLTRLDILE